MTDVRASAAAATTASRWVDHSALADVLEASKNYRGLHVVRGEPPTPLTVFRARDGRVFCVETGCPHAGHRLSNGHCLDPGDIEDLAPPGALGVLVSCPAHSYVYDTASGECVSAFGGGPGRAVVHATRVVDGVVQVDLEPAAGAGELALDTETRNEIGMRCVEQALELKFGD